MYNKYQIYKLILLYFILEIAIFAAAKSLKGKWKDLDVNSTEAKDAAQMGMERYSKKYYKGEHELIVVEVNRAEVQIVQGSKYRIKAVLGETECPKESKSRKCKLLKDAELLYCYFEMVGQPWKKQTKYLNIQCHTESEK